MLPEIPQGGLLTVDRTYPYAQLQVGNVVVFFDQRKNERIAHSLVQRCTLKTRKYGLIGPVVKQVVGWKTKGDNNRFRDRGYMVETNYRGRVVFVNGRRIER